MGKRSDTDKAIRNIMNWADRPEWSEEQAAVFDAHLAPVCDRIGIDQEELGQELAEHGYGGMLFGLMFEDFLSRRLPPDDRNIIDDYLKRRGWRESVPGRRYLKQLRDSTDNKTPRQCARSKKGREMVIEWLNLERAVSCRVKFRSVESERSL